MLFERDNAHVWVPDIGWIRLDPATLKSRTQTRPPTPAVVSFVALTHPASGGPPRLSKTQTTLF